MMPDTEGPQARVVAERLRMALTQGPLADGLPPVTVSGGVATAADLSRGAQALSALLDLADKRLYKAKQQRNQVVCDG